jgi:DNA-binding transcriptional MerR regulator
LDKKKIKYKGSDVGYSLQTIKRLLYLRPELQLLELQQKEFENRQQLAHHLSPPERKQTSELKKRLLKSQQVNQDLKPGQDGWFKESKVMEILLKTEMETNAVDRHFNTKPMILNIDT